MENPADILHLIWNSQDVLFAAHGYKAVEVNKRYVLLFRGINWEPGEMEYIGTNDKLDLLIAMTIEHAVNRERALLGVSL